MIGVYLVKFEIEKDLVNIIEVVFCYKIEYLVINDFDY